MRLYAPAPASDKYQVYFKAPAGEGEPGAKRRATNLKDRSLVPAPVMTHPDRWRLDQLLAWEEKRMAVAEAAMDALVAPERQPRAITDLLPQPKRRRSA